MTTQELYQHLQSKGLYYDIHETEDGFIISVEWGDWKHDHILCDELMKEKGWELDSECVSDEDGSDCYSSTHTYKRIK